MYFEFYPMPKNIIRMIYWRNMFGARFCLFHSAEITGGHVLYSTPLNYLFRHPQLPNQVIVKLATCCMFGPIPMLDISLVFTLERISGRIFCLPRRCCILNLYTYSFKAYRARLDLKSVWDVSHFKDGWSVIIVNTCPSTYGLNFLTNSIAAKHSCSVTE